MTDFSVRRSAGYQDLIITAGDMTIHTGLLDDAESLQVAIQLISAAEDLLPVRYENRERELIAIREALKGGKGEV